jgi:hypothetical protein
MTKDGETKDNDTANGESVDYYDQNFYNMLLQPKDQGCPNQYVRTSING